MANSILPDTDPRYDPARKLVRGFTVAAMAIGALPVPAASAAIVAENAAMVAAVGAEYGVKVSFASVMGALGVVGTLNVFGRTLFMEGARLLAWGTGPFGLVPVCVLGASTAGLQTWVIGQLAIALCRSGGAELEAGQVKSVVGGATSEFASQRSALVAEAMDRVRKNGSN